MTQRASAFVLEATWLTPRICGIYGAEDLLDAFAAGADFAVRVAPEELLLIGDPESMPIEESIPGGLIVDLTSAYASLSLRGPGRDEAFRRLSAMPLAESGVMQGLVAHVPAKVSVRGEELVVMVSSTHRSHLRARLADVAADLELIDKPATATHKVGV
jgi:hypothetical protein